METFGAPPYPLRGPTNLMFDSPNMAADIQQIMPILIVSGVACFILLFDVFLGHRVQGANPILALAGVLFALYVTVSRMVSSGSDKSFSDNAAAFSRSVSTDTLAGSAYVILLVAALLSIFMAWTYLQNRGLEHGEYYVLVLFSVAGAMLMAAAQDLIVLFLGLEVLSFALYVLAGFARTQEKSEESSIKYFLLGAFASAFFLYGIALMYGATQSTNLADIATVVGSATYHASPMLLGSIGMIIVGLGFKAALVPFHQWTPDVYEGAPTSVTAFMAGAAKNQALVCVFKAFFAI